ALIQFRNDRLHDVGELLLLLFVLLRFGVLIVLQPLDLLLDRLLHRGLVRVAHLRAELLLVGQLVLERVRVRLEVVARLHALLQLLVVVSELLRVLDHPFDVIRRQTVLIVCDNDLFAVAGALILGRHLQDTIRIDFEGDLDLRYAARRRWNAGQIKLAEQMVVLGHRTLALVHLNRDGVLAVGGRGEDLRFFRRNNGVSVEINERIRLIG
ncbi:NAD-specific glutamate dehydrogenase, partial [Ooceraea biroi]